MDTLRCKKPHNIGRELLMHMSAYILVRHLILSAGSLRTIADEPVIKRPGPKKPRVCKVCSDVKTTSSVKKELAGLRRANADFSREANPVAHSARMAELLFQQAVKGLPA